MFKKSFTDKRDYKFFKLDNDIDVVLIKDETAQISDVTLSVGTGSFEDTVEGIAHFLEHMLFLGSDKYPDEKFYGNYISNHGGYSNAFTAGDQTCYYYTIASEYLDKSLDIFSRFFIDPRLEASAVDREKNAVNSEHSKNITNDSWRNHQIIKKISNTNNPLSKFSTGNNETLAIPDIRDRVINFYENNYSANLMKLIILSNKDFDEMKNMAIKYFSEIKNKNYSHQRDHGYPLNLPLTLEVVPIKDDNSIQIIFQVKETKFMKKNNILNFLSHLIGYEGNGSIFNHLQNIGYATSLMAGGEETIDTYKFFKIKVKLTDEGFQNKDYVINCVFDYINKFISACNNDYNKISSLWEENKFLSQQSFNNAPMPEGSDYCVSISEKLHKINTSDKNELYNMFYSNYHFDDFNNEIMQIILEILNSFKLDNSLIIFTSKKFENNTSETEKYYGIKYNLRKSKYEYNSNKTIGETFIHDINKYVCKNTTFLTKKNIDKVPELYYSANGIKIYSYPHTNYENTQMVFNMTVELDYEYNNLNKTTLGLWTELLKHALNADLYDLQIANYNVSFSNKRNSFQIYIYGYPEKITDVTGLVLGYIKDFELNYANDNMLNIVKTNIKKIINNYKFSQPYSKINDVIGENCIGGFIHPMETLKVIDNITLDGLKNNIKTIFSKINIVTYLEGNYNENIISDIKEQISKYCINCEYFDINLDKLKIFKEKHNDKCFVKNENEHEKNCAVSISFPICYYRPGFTKDWEKISSLCTLTSNIVEKEFFDDLRTKQQLGYIVKHHVNKLGYNTYPQVLMSFLVQSDLKDCSYLQEKINNFINNFAPEFDKITESEFNEIKLSIIESLDSPFINLIESSNFYYAKITTSENVFNERQILISAISNTTLDEVKQFYKDNIVNKSGICVGIEK